MFNWISQDQFDISLDRSRLLVRHRIGTLEDTDSYPRGGM